MKIARCAKLAVGALLLGLTACGTGSEPPAVRSSPGAPGETSAEPRDAAGYAQDLFDMTNAARAAAGLPSLAPSECAVEMALGRAEALVGLELEHAPMQPVLEACGTDAAAENLVDSAATPQDVVDAWMDSPGHRNNIVDGRWSELGVSCVTHDAELLCAQIFLAPPRQS